jgi:hypothetical protein
MAMRDPGNFGPSASKGQLCPGATYAQENGNGKGRYNITFSYGMNGTNDHPDQSFGNRQNSTFGFTVDQVYRPHLKMRWIDSMTVRIGRGGERGQYFRNGEQSWREVGWGGVNTAPRHHLDVKSQKGRVNAVFFDGQRIGVAVEKRRVHGEPAEEILTAADEISADRIVMCGRKKTPVGKVLFGSVTQSVLLNAETPVTVIYG